MALNGKHLCTCALHEGGVKSDTATRASCPSSNSSRSMQLVRAASTYTRAPSSEVIKSHQRPSEVIRGHQKSSEVIRGHQRSSEVIRGEHLHAPAVDAEHCEFLIIWHLTLNDERAGATRGSATRLEDGLGLGEDELLEPTVAAHLPSSDGPASLG
jgi:hypothetical protein